ncbi:MAG: MBL fold metallo-hydrolase [Alphaproteobacteria bacterium]
MNAPSLIYPFATPPAPATLQAIAPGLFWLRMPLPFALNHVNLWLFHDKQGWTAIDTGINSVMTKNLWQQMVATACKGEWPSRLLVTHYHPDHAGLAGWLATKGKATLLMPRIEYFHARLLQMDVSEQLLKAWKNYYRFCGVPAPKAGEYFQRLRYHSLVAPLPATVEAIETDSVINIGPYQFTVRCYAGHSVGMACLYDQKNKILIAADQLLPSISPNVSVFASEPTANPLKYYLEGLADFFDVPDDVLILPSHGLPFYRAALRAKQIEQHHQERLQEIMDFVAKPKHIYQITQQLFKRPLDSQQMNFALGEMLAHVNYLLAQGKLERLPTSETNKKLSSKLMVRSSLA